MKRTLKDATIRSFHYATCHELSEYLKDLLVAYNSACPLRLLKGKTPVGLILQQWQDESDSFFDNLVQYFLGPIHLVTITRMIPSMPKSPHLISDDIFALLDDTKSGEEGSCLLFTEPKEEVVCYRGDQLNDSLANIDRIREMGMYLCGYISYEAGYYLVDKKDFLYTKRKSSSDPLIHFFAFQNCNRMTAVEAEEKLEEIEGVSAPTAIQNISLKMAESKYNKKFSKIKSRILSGETYQVNFTMKYSFDYQGSELALYKSLRERQSVEYGAFLNFPEYRVLSLSPELFVRKKGDLIESKPMKGTCARGVTPEDDRKIVKNMREDVKITSENAMIVDLMRNDISRVADMGTVGVKKLFEVQTYRTLHQMVSTVYGKIDKDKPVSEILKKMFPCGSITGAPKIRTMQIIEELEEEPRGVYTGAIGYVMPDNDVCFNVPIRTCVAYRDGQAEMGVGGGIIDDSNPASEYEECLVKAQFLTGINESFHLIESMLYDYSYGGIRNLCEHLGRLKESSKALHFQYDHNLLVSELLKAVEFSGSNKKVRLSLFQSGRYNIDISCLSDGFGHEIPEVGVSDSLVDSKWFLLQHKTSEREVYEKERLKHCSAGSYDVLFMNLDGEVTEASRHNLFIEKAGRLFTSPVESGLLGGVRRSVILSQEYERCTIHPLTPHDLLSADRIILTNSVKGDVEVSLSHEAEKIFNKIVKDADPQCCAR